MRHRLNLLLQAHRYTNGISGTQHGLTDNQVTALMKDLAPFIEQEVRDAVSSSSGDSLETIGWLGGDDS